MRKLKALFNPIFIFIGVQVAWIVLMAVWINWYLKIKEINIIRLIKTRILMQNTIGISPARLMAAFLKGKCFSSNEIIYEGNSLFRVKDK